MVWADGQLAPAQDGHGPLWSPGGLRDGVRQTAVGSLETRGRGAIAETKRLTLLGCSAKRVSLALRLVRVNVEGEEA